MPFADPQPGGYDLAIAGTGFAASFFLARWLESAPATARAIVLERGPLKDHAARVATRGSESPESFYRRSGEDTKRWLFTVGFGGGSNCWWGNAPRFLPADFEMKRRFGVGEDWPISYADLEPWYERAEAMMALSGPFEPMPFARRAPYTQPPHRMTDPEKLLKRAYPEQFFAMPTARARVATAGRGPCCGNGVCHLCPVDAKFTVINGLMRVYQDPRVTVSVGSEVLAVEHSGSAATGLRYTHRGAEKRLSADLVVLAANALFNPVILQRSSLDHPLLGRRLHEQVGLRAEAYLDGVEGFQGSSSVTGIGYMLYTDEARRRDMAGCLIETWNTGQLRSEFGKWRQVLPIRMVFDSLPDEASQVRLDAADPARPVAHYAGHGDYTQRAIARAKQDLERILAPLPVESVRVKANVENTEAHIIGTTAMGADPALSIVDRDCVHHRLRNLLVLGSSTFPTGGPANPSLTIAAQAMRAADRLAA